MGTVTAKQLKQKTGEMIKRVKSGEHLTITYRGKPVAVLAPATQDNTETAGGLRPFEEAWSDIEEALVKSKPDFRNWKEATEWVRSRT